MKLVPLQSISDWWSLSRAPQVDEKVGGSKRLSSLDKQQWHTDIDIIYFLWMYISDISRANRFLHTFRWLCRTSLTAQCWKKTCDVIQLYHDDLAWAPFAQRNLDKRRQNSEGTVGDKPKIRGLWKPLPRIKLDAKMFWQRLQYILIQCTFTKLNWKCLYGLPNLKHQNQLELLQYSFCFAYLTVSICVNTFMSLRWQKPIRSSGYTIQDSEWNATQTTNTQSHIKCGLDVSVSFQAI